MSLIIAFAGRKQSGKTTSCEFVDGIFNEYYIRHCYEKEYITKTYNFADPLKQLCIDILGLTHDQCYGSDESKNERVNCYRNYCPDDSGRMTARQVMQYVGTDVFRKMQTNVWSDATVRLIKKESPSLALIADCRFPNEVDAVKNNGGIVIKLDRDLYGSEHASEKALDEDMYDQSNFDLVIDNTKISVKEKNEMIYEFLIKTKRVLPL